MQGDNDKTHQRHDDNEEAVEPSSTVTTNTRPPNLGQLQRQPQHQGKKEKEVADGLEPTTIPLTAVSPPSPAALAQKEANINHGPPKETNATETSTTTAIATSSWQETKQSLAAQRRARDAIHAGNNNNFATSGLSQSMARIKRVDVSMMTPALPPTQAQQLPPPPVVTLGNNNRTTLSESMARIKQRVHRHQVAPPTMPETAAATTTTTARPNVPNVAALHLANKHAQFAPPLPDAAAAPPSSLLQSKEIWQHGRREDAATRAAAQNTTTTNSIPHGKVSCRFLAANTVF